MARRGSLLISTDADGADDATVQRLGLAGFVPKSDLPGRVAQRLLEGMPMSEDARCAW